MNPRTLRLIAIERPPSPAVAAAAAASPTAREVVDATLALYERRGYEPPWIGHLGFEGERCVGACGFAGPAAGGEVEIAYTAFEGHEGRGVATAMARELIRLTRPHASGLRYVAHTLPELGPSTSILRKLGFALVGVVEHPEDGPVWKWRERVDVGGQAPAGGGRAGTGAGETSSRDVPFEVPRARGTDEPAAPAAPSDDASGVDR